MWSNLSAWNHVGIDLPGHGASPPIPRGLHLVGLARLIGDFAVRHDVRHLVGISFGGMVALQVAIEFPQAFQTVVLGAPALGGGPTDKSAQIRNLELREAYRKNGAGPWLAELWMKGPPNIFAGASKQPALWTRLQKVIRDHPWHELSGDEMQRLTSHQQTPDQLQRVRAAGLIFVGEDDDDVFKRSAELIRRSLPACARIYLPSTGHLTLLERATTICPTLHAHFSLRRT
jgi:pimeloyl-ACP methyl ester carboxylesterase